MNPQASAFSLLEVSEILFSLTFNLKDLVGKTEKGFPGIGEDHFFAEAVEKLNPLGRLELLDLFCHSRLGDKQSFCRCTKTSVFSGKVKHS
jgi:hypothetical protein